MPGRGLPAGSSDTPPQPLQIGGEEPGSAFSAPTVLAPAEHRDLKLEPRDYRFRGRDHRAGLSKIGLIRRGQNFYRGFEFKVAHKVEATTQRKIP
ncbi:hypothetical protein GCM10017322_38470 [Paracoccus aerius]|nr:hypothetical protein GCM10017322_38470 [Paracoccus aerius]